MLNEEDQENWEKFRRVTKKNLIKSFWLGYFCGTVITVILIIIFYYLI